MPGEGPDHLTVCSFTLFSSLFPFSVSLSPSLSLISLARALALLSSGLLVHLHSMIAAIVKRDIFYMQKIAKEGVKTWTPKKKRFWLVYSVQNTSKLTMKCFPLPFDWVEKWKVTSRRMPFDSIWSAARLCTVDTQQVMSAIWQQNYLIRYADIAKLTPIPRLLRNNEIGWSSLTVCRPFSHHQTGCLFEITLMKGALAKNRHVLLLEGGGAGKGRRGGVGALTAFITINKMERFTSLSWGLSPEVGENPTP